MGTDSSRVGKQQTHAYVKAKRKSADQRLIRLQLVNTDVAQTRQNLGLEETSGSALAMPCSREL
jgi:hypothetical protein